MNELATVNRELLEYWKVNQSKVTNMVIYVNELMLPVVKRCVELKLICSYITITYDNDHEKTVAKAAPM